MSKKELRLKDYIRVTVDSSIRDLDDAQRILLKDSFGKKSKGLFVTFDLSHSGRRINNRIYPPWGQRDGASSWTEPFRRPIIVNHDSSKDPIGRFVSVTWQSLEREALDHLGDVKAYLSVKKALDSNDPQHIYQTYKRYGLLDDKNWPGVGKLVAKALITDPDAIEKFLDGRYLTFSAGSRTNAYTCMVCGSDWHAGEICDHRPGVTDEDGNTAVFMTGLFLGDEGSVVNMPADVFSQVSSLELQDVDASLEKGAWTLIGSDESNFVLTDSIMEVTSMKIELQDLMQLEPETVLDKLVDKTLGFDLKDLQGTTPTEIQWLIRVHDSLHQRYDYELAEYGTGAEAIPTDVFKIHGTLHKLSVAKGFRDSFINGQLDHFDDAGGPGEEYVVKRAKVQDFDLADNLNSLKDVIMQMKEALVSHLDKPNTESEVKDDAGEATESTDVVQDDGQSSVQSTEEKQEDQEKVETETEEVNSDTELSIEDRVKALLDEDKQPEEMVAALKSLFDNELDFVDDDEIDWFVMDAALQAFVAEDAKLSTEQREKLSSKSFCGPDRSFPVPDCAHVTAARRLIGRAKLSSAQKDKVLACVNRKAKSLGCDSEKDECNISTSSEGNSCTCGVQEDYVQALQQVDSLKEQLKKVLEVHASALKAEVSDSEDSVRLDSLLAWFDSISEAEVLEDSEKDALAHIKPVDNPSGASSEGKDPKRKLGDFEQRILDKYQTIRSEEGQEKADHWLMPRRKYLPPSLDLTSYLTN